MYQLQPAGVWFVPQVLSEVQTLHILVDEAERMYLGRIHAHERDYVYTPVVEDSGYVDLIGKPLQGSCQ